MNELLFCNQGRCVSLQTCSQSLALSSAVEKEVISSLVKPDRDTGLVNGALATY